MTTGLPPEEKRRVFLPMLNTFDDLTNDIKVANDDHNYKLSLIDKRYVRVREKLNILAVCCTLQEIAELYGCCEYAEGAYWAPDWFFMAVWPAAKKSNRAKAEERAYHVTFDARYRKAMPTPEFDIEIAAALTDDRILAKLKVRLAVDAMHLYATACPYQSPSEG